MQNGAMEARAILNTFYRIVIFYCALRFCLWQGDLLLGLFFKKKKKAGTKTNNTGTAKKKTSYRASTVADAFKKKMYREATQIKTPYLGLLL